MSNEPATGEGVDDEIPDTVREWLSSVAAERGLSETELLQAMLTGDGASMAGPEVDDQALDRLEERFRSMIEDIRERVIQVKRETDGKAPLDHTHHDLNSSIEQVGRDLVALEAEIDQLDDRITAGFENYEEILTYLTETTDELNRRLTRLVSAVVDLREQVGQTSRDEVRRTALAHLTGIANRHGVDTATCSDCEESVDVSLLVEPRCPHCDSPFTSLEPKRGFFRKSVLHTGRLPALESAPVEDQPSNAGLASLVGEGPRDQPPSEVVDPPSDWSETPSKQPTEQATSAMGDNRGGSPGERAEAVADLQSIDGIGPAYAERLAKAGIADLRALAVADAEELGDAIDVSASVVADWIDRATAQIGS